jgi:hypothetical protein
MNARTFGEEEAGLTKQQMNLPDMWLRQWGERS